MGQGQGDTVDHQHMKKRPGDPSGSSVSLVSLTEAVPSEGGFEAPIFNCPTELIIKILSLLPIKSLFSASLVCKRLHEIIQDSLLLHYMIELQAGGLVDSELSYGKTSERLQVLRDRERRWRTLDWRHIESKKLREGCPMYELYGGAFAQLWDQWNLETRARRSNLNVWYLPSGAHEPKELSIISHGDLGVGTVLELGIDPDQDLLVLIAQMEENRGESQEQSLPTPPNVKLVSHFRTLSKNERHAGAREPVLTFEPPEGAWDGASRRIIPLICGDLFALFFSAVNGTSGLLAVYRWTTGQKLLYIETPSPALSFTFLSEDTIVIPCISQDEGLGAALHVYRIPTDPMEPTDDITRPIVDKPEPLLTYQLPDLNSQVISGYNVICRSHPFPSPRAYIPNSKVLAYTYPPFQTDPADRIVTFSFIFNIHREDPLGHGVIAWQESHVLVTHVSALLAHLPKEQPATPTIVPWEQWSHAARWLDDRCRRNWYSHTYGHRFVKPTRQPADDHHNAFEIQILDFNPYNVRRELAKGLEESKDEATLEAESSTLRIVTEPTVVEGHVFANTVTTNLPYIEVTSKKTMYDFDGVMLCEEHVLNLKQSRRAGFDLLLDIFSV